MMNRMIFILPLIACVAWSKPKAIKEVKVELKCAVGLCPDMAGFDGLCASSWVVADGVIPPAVAEGSLPECKCTPTRCNPSSSIWAIGTYKKHPDFPSDMEIKVFNIKTIVKK